MKQTNRKANNIEKHTPRKLRNIKKNGILQIKILLYKEIKKLFYVNVVILTQCQTKQDMKNLKKILMGLITK